MKERIEELEKLLNRWEYCYRVLDNPEVNDETYDKTLEEYKQLAKIYPQFITKNSPMNKIGTVLIDGFKKIEHKRIMGSLNNTYNLDELREWKSKFDENITYNLEDKFDGISGSLIYENEQLIKAVTRGNGVVGDDITNNAKMVWNIPHEIKEYSGEIRGEFIILKKDVDRINKLENASFKNARNLVSGTMKSLDSNIVRKRFVHFIPYYFFNDNEEIEDEKTISFLIEQFKKNGFNWFESLTNISFNQVVEYLNKMKDSNNINYFRNRDYPVDGAVIKISNLSLRKKLGYTSNCPNWAIAFKYEQEKAITTVKEITWQVGRDRITPVAELESVDLEGTTVSRATIHNVTQLKRLKITKGCKVEIEKAGFIIPYINKVIEETNDEIFIPEVCPTCGSKTEIVKNESEILTCTNPFCKDKLKSICEYSMKALDIDEIGESLISELIDKDIVKTPLDIMKLKYEQLITLDRMGKVKVNKILKNLNKAIVQPLSKVIEFLGIKDVGKITSEKLSNHYKSLNEIFNADLTNIDDIGPIIASNIQNYYTTNKKYIEETNDFFIIKEIKQSSNILEGKRFVVTGSATKPREFIEKLIKDNGGLISSSVSNKTNILIIGSLESDSFNSTKKKKAIELNIEIHNEQWLFDLLNYKDEQHIEIKKEETIDDWF